MRILKDIWKTLFGKSNKSLDVSGITITKMEVVHKKETANTIGGYSSVDAQPDKLNSCNYKVATKSYCEQIFAQSIQGVCNPPAIIPNGDDFFASKELIEKEKRTDNEVNSPAKNKKNKNVIGQKTLSEIKEYILTYGSIDVLTCQQKFKVKSLRNFIWFLRNEGFEIKTDKVGLHNELGQKIEVTNYRLISKK